MRPSVRACVPHFLIVILQLFERNVFFEKGAFSTKISEIEAHFFFEKGAFSTKNSEIEAHFFFEKGAFSTEISEI